MTCVVLGRIEDYMIISIVLSAAGYFQDAAQRTRTVIIKPLYAVAVRFKLLSANKWRSPATDMAGVSESVLKIVIYIAWF